MTTRILVPLDGSAVAEEALAHAAAVAKVFGAPIVLARVPESTLVPVMSAGVWITRVIETEEAHAEAEDYLKAIASRPELQGLAVERRMPEYPVVDALLDLIDSERIDLVVMTTHGRSGPARWVMGSVAERVVHGAKVATYIVRSRRRAPDPGPDFSRIVVPLDGSALSELALAPAERLAASVGGTLHLVRVPVVPGYLTVLPETAGWIPEQLRTSAIKAEAYLAEKAGGIMERGVAVETDVETVVEGTVAEGIIDAAHEHRAGLIIMSSHGRTGFDRWLLGSVADRVLRGAECATWIVRASAG